MPGESRQLGSESGYGLVLLVIAVTYIVSVATDNLLAAAIVIVLQFVALHVVFLIARARRRYLLAVDTAALLAVILTVFIAAQGNAQEHAPLVQAVFWISAAVYGLAPLLLIRRAINRPVVDVQSLLAAIAAYVMLGMFFAFTYRALAASQSGPFFGSAGDGSVSDDLFFSFITLTTTGYGDLVPAGNPGQTLAAIEAVTGELFLVTAIAKVVNQSGILSRRRRTMIEPDPVTHRDTE